jgi:aspartate carbamoyltransferase catalytic subunit
LISGLGLKSFFIEGGRMRGLFNLSVLKTEQINSILSLAFQLKSGFSLSYSGKRIATLFFENSTRTHNSFVMAMLKLGIEPVVVDVSRSSVSKGETLYDTVKTLEAIGFDGVVIRHSDNEYYKQLDKINIPIWNAGDGSGSHPTQSLLDLMTIKEEFGEFKGLKCCIVGDIIHSRVAHTNAEIMKRLGMDVYIAGPKEFLDDTAPVISLDKAIESCDIIMLLRVQFERNASLNMSREEYHSKYGLNMERVNKMKEHSIIMHPAPVNRGIEIADDVVECSKSRIFKQMTNGVFVRMAVISKVLEGEI